MHDTKKKKKKGHKQNVNRGTASENTGKLQTSQTNEAQTFEPLRICRYAVRGHQTNSCVCDEFQVAATSETTRTATNHCHRRRNVASLS